MLRPGDANAKPGGFRADAADATQTTSSRVYLDFWRASTGSHTYSIMMTHRDARLSTLNQGPERGRENIDDAEPCVANRTRRVLARVATNSARPSVVGPASRPGRWAFLPRSSRRALFSALSLSPAGKRMGMGPARAHRSRCAGNVLSPYVNARCMCVLFGALGRGVFSSCV